MRKEDYPHKLKPFDHQLNHFNNFSDEKSYGLLWEMGVGKSKPIIDTACWLWEKGEIDSLVVVAPPGVERNWLSSEIPAHMPDKYLKKMRIEIFKTSKKNSVSQKQAMKALLKTNDFAVLLISYPAFMTREGKAAVWAFLKARKPLYVLDEAHYIKTPDAKRTKSIVASGKYAEYKRILTGTPLTSGAFDIYTQVKFLNEDFWKSRGIATYGAFKHHFGRWITLQTSTGRRYEKLTEYVNLGELKDWVSSITDRITKEDVLDLPPKLYTKYYVEMSKEQSKAYTELKEQFMYELENGEIIDGELPIVRLLRLQQILCNYVPTGEDNVMQRISPTNNRIKAIEALRDSIHTPTIIWARFRQDIDQIMEVLGDDAVRYDGSITDDEAEANKNAFQNGDVKWFVGTAQKGATGITLHRAKTVIYYSNNFRLTDRLQSEDRAHRAGMDGEPVNYIDIVCPGTVDDRIVDNLRAKKEIASEILGDAWKEWI